MKFEQWSKEELIAHIHTQKRIILVLMSIILLTTTGCANMPCEGGIGAVYKHFENTVEYTYEGSPAEGIGLQQGDEILYPWDIKGMPGSHHHVRIIRNGDLIVFNDVPLVCVDELRKNWVPLSRENR